jgi:WD40 repeat protein
MTGQSLYVYKGHTHEVRALAWSPDGTRLVSSGDDGTAQVWDAETGAELLTYRGHTGPFAGATRRVFGIAWSPDGTCIVSGDDQAVHVWAAAMGQEA